MRYFFRDIYGNSYRGSGGASATIELENARLGGEKDNGFVVGPAWVEPIDPSKPARVRAKGYDCVGDGRWWGEEAIWDPESQQWVAVG